MENKVLGSVLTESQHKAVMRAMKILEKALKRSEDVGFHSPEGTRKYLLLKMSHLDHEEFGAMYIDNRNRLICSEVLFTGTIDGANVYPRECVKAALHHGCAAVILFHNHPSGEIVASNADRQITDRLKAAYDLIGVRLLDHLIVGHGKCCSFAEQGWI